MFRSACSSFTHSSPRRALARQLIRRGRSPGTNRRRSANSIPSPFSRATWLPENTWVSSGPQQRLHRLGPRVDLERLQPLEPRLVGEQPEPVVRAHEQVPIAYPPQRCACSR